MFQDLPSGWPRASTAAIAEALATAHLVMDGGEVLVRRLGSYFAPAGQHAGATFLSINPDDPVTVGPADLLAVTVLGRCVPPPAVRRLVEHNADSRYVNSLLAARELDPTIDLLMAGTATLATMAELHVAVVAALSPAAMSAVERWATAAALCARKRPHLFPTHHLGWATQPHVGAADGHTVSWQVYYALLDDGWLIDRLERTLDQVSANGGNPGDRAALLHHLGVALQTHSAHVITDISDSPARRA